MTTRLHASLRVSFHGRNRRTPPNSHDSNRTAPHGTPRAATPSPPNALSIKDRSFIELNEIALPLFIDLVQNSLADKRRLLSSMSERAEANSSLAAYIRLRQTNLVNYPTPEEFVLEQVSTINHPVRSRLFRYVRLLPMHREIGWMITDASGRQLTNWTIALENQ